MIDRLKRLWPFHRQRQPTRRRPSRRELSEAISGALTNFVQCPDQLSDYSLEAFFAGPFRDRFLLHLSSAERRGERLVFSGDINGIYFERE